jgi:3-hydroxyacyl-[acyl-carrier-protein] dehydratase
MKHQDILHKLPYNKPFLFVDELLSIDENGATGTYTYHQDLFFYEGHFKDFPITPGVILTETMAQIGLVCLGIYLSKDSTSDLSFAMTSNSIDFLKPVYPNEKVIVTSKKIYFRFNKLSCEVKMENELGEMVCKGTIAGMITKGVNG